MASGEMSAEEYRSFLQAVLRLSCSYLMPGGTAMAFIDWRHVADLIGAAEAVGVEMINLCVWTKTNGGMGSLYRSKHELVGVFRKPGRPGINNVELGRHKRYRTNVWECAGVNTFRKGRAEDLADHPTVKPTALLADAIKDVTHRGNLVLDPFGGSGSTLLAAERTGRVARLMELDPLYVDLIVRRWTDRTGQEARLDGSGLTFTDVREHRTPVGREADDV